MKCPQCRIENPDNSQFCLNCGKSLDLLREETLLQTKIYPEATNKINEGTLFGGRYKIEKELGRGGMGIVYKAEDTKLKRTVALKFLPPELSYEPEFRSRFFQEAQAAAALDHPHICTIHEIDEMEEKTFISMTYVEGQSLKEKIDEKPMKLDEALDIISQVAVGLDAAHKKGIVHRDIKGANIMVDSSGHAKIMDFGLAKIAGVASLTKMGSTVGTIAYMSPEQAKGEPIDHRTDIWSLGVTLFEMITGLLPFKGESEQSLIYSILHNEPDPITGLRTGIPMSLERVVAKAMSKNPDERYQHMDDMIVDLQSAARELNADKKMETAVPTKGHVRPIENTFLFKELLQTRIPQILGTYIVICISIVFFLDWLVRRYPLSPRLPLFCLVALSSIIPSILLLAYSKGRKDRDHWKRVGKIGIPINLAVSAVILFVLFQGKDLGATTTTLSLQDEEGLIIERIIPKNEFRKKAAVFFFNKEEDDATPDWVIYAISDMVKYDLSQDIYLDVISEFNVLDKIKEKGFSLGEKNPFTLKKKIVNDLHIKHFITGTIVEEDGLYLISTELHDTKTFIEEEGSNEKNCLFFLPYHFDDADIRMWGGRKSYP